MEYGPAIGIVRTPFGSIGVPIGTAQKNGIASRLTRSGTGEVSQIVRVFPRATMPAMWGSLPALYAFSPTTSARKPFNSAGPFILGLRLRSIEYLNVCAVTGSFEGGEKRNPLRILNVYVLPSADRAGSDWATSGTTREPAGPALSG